MVKKTKYWGKQQDELCKEWVTVSGRSDQTRVYNALHPTLLYMSRTILTRYFNFPRQFEEDYVEELVQHTFIRMPRYNEAKAGKNGWYSFVQTIIKNHSHELMRNHNGHLYPMENQTLVIVAENYSQDDSVALQIHELKTEALEHFEHEAIKCKHLMNRSGNTAAYREKMERTCEYLRLVLIYLEEHDAYGIISMHHYMLANSDMDWNEHQLAYLTAHYFGMYGKIGAKQERNFNRISDKYSYVQDDYPTSTRNGGASKLSRGTVESKTARRKQMNDPEFSRWMYF